MKLSTFIYRCVEYHLGEMHRSIRRRRNRPRAEPIGNVDVAAPDQLHDHQIERLGHIALHEPARLGLSATEFRIIRALADAEPGTEMRTITEQVGFAWPASLSTAIVKMRGRFAGLDVQGADVGPIAITKPGRKPRPVRRVAKPAVIVQSSPPGFFNSHEAATWMNANGNLVRPVEWFTVAYWARTRHGGPDRVMGKT